VAAPDLFGYGAAGPWTGRGAFTLSKEAAPIHSLIARLGEPVHLVGHSYGGAVALHIALTRPELVQSLTLIEPVAFHLLRGGDRFDRLALDEIGAVAADVNAALASGDYHRGFGRFVDYWSGPGSWSALPAEKRGFFAAQLGKVALDFHAAFSERTSLDDVRRLDMPVLLMQGGCTPPPPRCVVHRLRSALPRAALKVVQGAGHMLPITHREEVNALVADHLEAASLVPRRQRAALAA
jgi:pimeloyl-ACP methyl ester carboxylesterase